MWDSISCTTVMGTFAVISSQVLKLFVSFFAEHHGSLEVKTSCLIKHVDVILV